MRAKPNWIRFFICVSSCTLLVLSCGSCPVVGQTNAPTIETVKESFLPSPLSSFDSAIDQPAYFSSTVDLNQFVTHNVDLKDVLSAYSNQHKCSLNEAFAAAAKKLQMVPRDRDATDLTKLRNAVYSQLQNDVYSITARQVFFNELQGNLYQLRFGDQQIVIEVRFVSIPVKDIDVLQTFMIPDTFQAFGNQLPQIIPESTYATASNANQQDRLDQPEASGTVVIATETTSRALPTFIGKMDPDGIQKLLKFSRSRVNLEITQAPTLAMFPGTRATVTDAASQPFVVSVKRIEHKLGVSYQPVIQSIENGTKMMFQAEPKDGKIQLVGDLVFSKILGVENFTYRYPNDEKGRGVSIQVPEHHVRKVHWSTQLEPGNTLLIDPVESFEKKIKPKTRLKDAVHQKMRRIILVRAVLVDKPLEKSNQ